MSEKNNHLVNDNVVVESFPVQMIVGKKTGKLFVTSKSNPEYGYVQIVQSTIVTDGYHTYDNERNSIIPGSLKSLKLMHAKNGGVLAGNIIHVDFLENEIPERMRQIYFNQEISEEENLLKFQRTNGKLEEGAIVLTKDGQRIIRFKVWDPTGLREDAVLDYDNTAEAKAARNIIRATRKAITAKVVVGVPPVKTPEPLPSNTAVNAPVETEEDTTA